VLNRELYDQEYLKLIGCEPNAQTLLGGRILQGEFNLSNGMRFAVFNTLWGDGRYRGSDGFDYCVDSGSIGIIPLEMCDKEKLKEIEELGTIHTFDDVIHVASECNRSTGDGDLVFGHIRINTNPSEDEYEEGECDRCGGSGIDPASTTFDAGDGEGEDRPCSQCCS
jgi:hypothetical protein